MDLGGVEDRAGSQDVADGLVTVVGSGGAASGQVRGELVPFGVGAGGLGLADAGGAEAQADVAFAAYRVGELQEPPVLLGRHDRGGDDGSERVAGARYAGTS